MPTFGTLPGRRGLLFCLLLAGATARARASAFLTEASGIVQVRAPGNGWITVDRLPRPLEAAETVRVGAGARALLRFDDGSRVELGADSLFTLEEASGLRDSLRLGLGSLRAFVERIEGRRFEVRTPTAVCSVRGTEFGVSVLSGGRTRVDLYRGLLGIEDNRGRQLLLRPEQSLRIDQSGMAAPERLPTGAELRREGLSERMRREVRLDLSKEEVLAAAAREIKLAEFQQGKAIVDVSGARVRIEEYVMRPRADQFKLVVLNKRRDRFDYFYYLGTANKVLPSDLSAALRQLGGGLDAPPEYFLTAYETGRSNTSDSIRELAAGGHLVDVHANADPADDRAGFFDPALDRFVDAAGRRLYLNLFDDYGFYVNGKLKDGWTGSNIQSYNTDIARASTLDPITGAVLTPANAYLDGNGFLAIRTGVSTTFPDARRMHQRVYESFADGSFLSWDNYIIDDEGRIASVADFAGVRSGADFRRRLLDFNYEQVITATEFGGRKIDLVVEPKILIQSGLIQ